MRGFLRINDGDLNRKKMKRERKKKDLINYGVR